MLPAGGRPRGGSALGERVVVMKFLLTSLSAALLFVVPLFTSPAFPGETAAAPIASEWRNPSNSVHIRLDRCGGALCGVVTWASPKAIADAKRGGTDQLVGTRLFRNLEPAGTGVWKGKVFVPDIRKTFAGTIEFKDGDKMLGKGCVLFGIVCKSQTWSRVK